MRIRKKSGVGQVFDQMLQQIEDQPVEFQLPEWCEKQNSLPYTVIKRNVYVTKKIKRRAEDDGIFCSCRPSSGLLAVCNRDCHCGMLMSSCSQSCKCEGLCVNKPFQNRPVKKMKVVKTEKCGSGVIAEEDIKQGDFVIEYVGEVIDDKTCEERLWRMKRCGETNFFLCEINRDMVIDATYKGNKSRYINHSCQPNTQMQKWTIDGETRIGIFAIRDIIKGEELTYDYQYVQFGADQDCYCGAIECRQKLGFKPNKLNFSSTDAALQFVLREIASPSVKALLNGKDELPNGRSETGSSSRSVPSKKKTSSQNCIGEAVRVWCARDKRYYGGVISNFDSSSRKHTDGWVGVSKSPIKKCLFGQIVLEDGRVETYDLSVNDWDFL